MIAYYKAIFTSLGTERNVLLKKGTLSRVNLSKSKYKISTKIHQSNSSEGGEQEGCPWGKDQIFLEPSFSLFSHFAMQ